MRFKSLDELVQYMFDNNVVIGDIEMNIDGATAEDPTVTPDVVAEPPAEEPVEEPLDKLEESIVIHFASGSIQAKLDDNGYLLVDSVQMTPNSCGAGSIVIEGRKVHLNMCEMDGKTMAYLHTSKGANEPIAVRVKN